MIFRLSNYSHEDAVISDQSQSENNGNNTNILDEELNRFLTDVDDGIKFGAIGEPDVLEDLQMDSMIDDKSETEDAELFNL